MSSLFVGFMVIITDSDRVSVESFQRFYEYMLEVVQVLC